MRGEIAVVARGVGEGRKTKRKAKRRPRDEEGRDVEPPVGQSDNGGTEDRREKKGRRKEGAKKERKHSRSARIYGR